jgi:transcriptional regulator with XRE-family HTH domain
MNEKVKKPKYVLRLYLYKLRIKKGMSAYQVAKALGIHKQQYYAFEDGYILKYGIDIMTLFRLSELLDISFEEITKLELEWVKECIECGVRKENRKKNAYIKNR